MSFVAQTERIPGVKQQFKLQRQPGLAQGTPKVLLIGERLTASSSANDNLPKRVRSRAEATAIGGSGSKIDLMAKAAFESAALSRFDAERGITPEIHIMAVAPLIAPDVAAVFTLTFSGTATTSGILTCYVADQSVTVPVAVGDTAANVAAAIEAELARVEPELPFTAGVASAVITFTAREFGAHGNGLVIEVSSGFGAPAGISAAVAQTVVGTGNVDISDALDAAANTGPWNLVVIGEDSAAARTALKTHVQASWDYEQALYHLGLCSVEGDLSDAETAAAALDDWRIALVNNEKVTGSGVPWDVANAGLAFQYQIAAGCGARLFSQSRANYNFNNATLAQPGRPRNVDRTTVNDAINAGVTVVLEHKLGTSPGQIIDFVSTATTDQTGTAPGAPDLTWAPFEIAKVVQQIAKSVDAELAGFAQLNATELTRQAARAACLTILREANRENLVSSVDDDQVTAEYEAVGGSTHLVIGLDYGVITGLDIIAVSHNVTRAVN